MMFSKKRNVHIREECGHESPYCSAIASMICTVLSDILS